LQTVNMDITGGRDLKKLFRRDSVLHDNFLFKLHHQANFFFVLFGAVFLFGMNYLNGNAITCLGGNDYITQYCWLHGSSKIKGKIFQGKADYDPITSCVADEAKSDRHTHYYLWVPFVLTLCLAIIKAPRVIWKEACERGIIKGVVGEGDEHPEKMTHKFVKLKKRANLYHISFFFCELLNIVCLVLCFVILNQLFDGQFTEYGSKALNYDKADPNSTNAMCNLFPTEVSCTVNSGGINGNNDKTNVLCLLSNNLFNQYYFVILWVWWVFLFACSAVGFVYRLAQYVSPSFSKMIFINKMVPFGQGEKARKLTGYKQGDYFLLGRICQNMKGSRIEEFINELIKQRDGDRNGENQAIMNA